MLFVAKCLTLDQFPERVDEVRAEIAANKIIWEEVVQLSSRQLVMPALYLQFKRNGLLPDLPADLTKYLSEITELNRERNLAILAQAEEITSILSARNIQPVFLKGTAHLLCDLYNDIAERMLGDIDILLPEDRMVEAAEILIEMGFKSYIEFKPGLAAEIKHYPRLQNLDYPAAVEIHREILNFPNQKILSGIEILNDKQKVNIADGVAFIPSAQKLMIHNVLNSQLSDRAFVNGYILLRQLYDFWLLSQNKDALQSVQKFDKKRHLFKSYLTQVNFVFSIQGGIVYKETFRTKFFLKRLIFLQDHPTLSKIYRTVLYFGHRIARNVTFIVLSVFKKDTRKFVVTRLTDRKWYAGHFRSYMSFFNK